MKNYIETRQMSNSNVMRISFDREKFLMNPEYQRNGDIWGLEKRQYLIDSILNDYDLPKLYFHNLSGVNSKNAEKEYAVVDGRQRLETIWAFIDGKFKLSDDFILFSDRSVNAKGMTYNDLAQSQPRMKVHFDSYNLPITIIETDDMDLIEDMFLRLNEAVPLNAAEKRNAIGGLVVQQIKKVVKHTFFTKKVKFNNNRYQHQEVAVRLLFLLHSTEKQRKVIDTKKVYLDEFVRSNKSKDEKYVKQLGNKVIHILDKLSEIFIDSDPLLRSQSYVPIYFLLTKSAQESEVIIRRDMISEFRDEITENKKIAADNLSKADFELLEFDRLSQQGTNDAVSIKERYRIISKRFNVYKSLD